LGGTLLGHEGRETKELVDNKTPLGLSAYLRENPVEGLVYNPQWWGDWLVISTGPKPVKVFMTNNMHLVPSRAWQDYWHLFDAKPNWRQVLDRYNIDAVIVDAKEQEILLPVLQKDTSWEEKYSDDQASLFVRKLPTKKKQPAQNKGGLAIAR